MVCDCLVVANDTLVSPAQYLGIFVAPVRSSELSQNCIFKVSSRHVSHCLAIRYKAEELSCIHSVTELGRQVHNGVAFSLTNHLGQRCPGEVGVEHRGAYGLHRGQLSRVTNEDDLAVVSQLEDESEQLLVYIAGFINEQQYLLLAF